MISCGYNSQSTICATDRPGARHLGMRSPASTSGPLFPDPATVPIDPGLLQRVLERLNAEDAAPAGTPATEAPLPRLTPRPPPLPDRSHILPTIKLDLSAFPEPSVIVDAEATSPGQKAVAAPADNVVLSPDLLPNWPEPRTTGLIQLTDVVDVPARDWSGAIVLAAGLAFGALVAALFFFAPGASSGSTSSAVTEPVVPAATERMMPELDLSAPTTAPQVPSPALKPAQRAFASPVRPALAPPARPVKTAAPVVKPAQPPRSTQGNSTAAPATVRPSAPAPAAPAKAGPAKPSPARTAAPGRKGPLAVNCPEPVTFDPLGGRE